MVSWRIKYSYTIGKFLGITSYNVLLKGWGNIMPRKEPTYNVTIKEMTEEQQKEFDEKVVTEVAKFLLQVLPFEVIDKLVERLDENE